MSTILAFKDVDQGELIFPGHLQRERERFEDQVNNLIVEKVRYLEEVWGVSKNILAIKATVEPFKYSGTLVEKVWWLSYEVAEMNEVLAFVQ